MSQPRGGRCGLARLPDFPWDHAHRVRRRPAAHPGGIVDLSVGTPVDPTPEVVQQALRGAADSPGYPITIGRLEHPAGLPRLAGPALRGDRSSGLDGVLPVIGSKELIGSLPTHLGLGPDDLVVYPELAYPTYEVGARLAGARTLATDALTAVGPERVALVWVNSPSNPTGRVLPVEHLRKVVDWCRERGALLVSDECYLECAWSDDRPARSACCTPTSAAATPPGSSRCTRCPSGPTWPATGARSSPGTRPWSRELLAVRKNLGLQMPGPQQVAMRAALDDDEHVDEQHARYAARRTALKRALERAGFRIDHSEASLYLWATRDEPCWDTVAALAEHGILVAPGEFYGAAGAHHVRVAFTATDERVDAAVERLAGCAEPTLRRRLRASPGRPRGIGRAAPWVIGVRTGASAKIRTAETLLDADHRVLEVVGVQHDARARRRRPTRP